MPVSSGPEAPPKPTVRTAPAPTVIEVEDVWKTFRIPTQRLDTLKERAIDAFKPGGYRTLEAVRGVSFEVRRGEFIGIVGRNGSGKSTLLKVLASIYRADRGSVRVAGRLAPFIELGVGFNPEMTAVDNVVLNGVMMGLTPREARARYDAVIEFAELEEFSELKLKNYSSGMMVRLAFSLMLQVDADVLLFDEVLAVGDASFQQRCAEAFRGLREAGKTIVLVTHDMHAVERNCQRALIIDEGRIERIGSPTEIAREYLEVNMRKHLARVRPREHRTGSATSRAFAFERVWLEGPDGEEVSSIAANKKLTINTLVRATEDAPESFFSFELRNGEGVPLFALPYRLLAAEPGRIRAGDRFRLRLSFLAPPGFDSYFAHCAIASDANGSDQHTLLENAASFLVYDAAPPGSGPLAYEMDVGREPTPEDGAR